MTLIPTSNLEFLKKLKKNNNRDWFNKNKELYLKEHAIIIAFADELLKELNKHDNIETESGKKSLFRIYRDVRFSKDKTPYNCHWSGGFSRATKKLRGGYYFRIEADKAYIAGGFWNPNPQDLKRVRDEIAYDAAPLRKILKNKNFINTFGALQGEQVQKAPKGFPADHPNIDLLKFKQFLLVREFNAKELLSKNFLKEVNQTYKNMRPFFDYMSDVLTSDMNGESII